MPQPSLTPGTVERARTNLLEARYGQFDLIPALIPLPSLLQEKPRQVRRLIAARLEIPEERIRYRTFISWLARFRRRHAALPPKNDSPTETTQEPRPSEPAADWRSFRASEPQRQGTAEGTTIAFPRYD